MTAVIELATLNINGITTKTRVGMMTEYIDIVFIQEITSTDVLNMPGYKTYNNIGTQMCGTAILAQREIPLTNITKLLKGRVIAAEYKGIHLVNIHAPSGTAR
jgi:exonuclease III